MKETLTFEQPPFVRGYLVAKDFAFDAEELKTAIENQINGETSSMNSRFYGLPKPQLEIEVCYDPNEKYSDSGFFITVQTDRPDVVNTAMGII